MSSWRDRAVPVTASTGANAATAGWRSRAVPVQAAPEKEETTQDLVKKNFQSSKGESFGAGGAQGLLFNFFDELYGAAQHPVGAAKKVAGLLGYDTTGDKDVANYERERDTARQAFDAAREQNPGSYVAGEVTGALAGSAAPVLNVGKVASVGGRLARAGMIGGVAGAGGSTADSAKGLLVDTGIGAGGGVAGQGIGEGIGKVISRARGAGTTKLPAKPGESVTKPNVLNPIANRLSDRAEKRAVKASGAMLGDFRALDNKGRLNETGRMLLDKKVVTPMATLKNVSDRAGKLINTEGNKILQVENALDEKFDDMLNSEVRDKLFNPQRAAERLRRELVEEHAGTAMEEAIPLVEKEINRLMARGNKPLNFKEARRIKKALDKFIDHSKEQTPQKELLKQARGIINNEIENAVEAVGEATKYPLLNKWKESKKIFGIMKDVQEMADDKLFRADANRYISPSDYGMGVGGGLLGAMSGGEDSNKLERGLIYGGLVGGANRFGRVYGPALGAKLLDSAAKNTRRAGKLIDPMAAGVEKALRRGIGARLGAESAGGLLGNE